MRPPPPSYPPPPTPSAHALPAGYTITLSGPPDAVTKQQRLIPLSRNILCLPALTWTTPGALPAPSAPPSTRSPSTRNASRLSRSSSGETRRQSVAGRPRSTSRNSGSSPTEPAPKPTIAQLRASVFKLHQEFIQRYEMAREFLEAPKALADGDRRMVIYNGSERDIKAVCIEGLRQGLKDDEEVEKVWHELLEGGVDGLLDYNDGQNTPRGNPTRLCRADSNSEGVKHSQNTDHLERGNSVSTTRSSIRSRSPGRSSFASDEPIDPRRLSTLPFSRPRTAGPPYGSLPPLPATNERDEQSDGRHQLERTSEAESETDEPRPRSRRLDSTYSSGMDSLPSLPAIEDHFDSMGLMMDFRFQEPQASRRSSSPTRDSRAGSVVERSMPLSPRHLPDGVSGSPVEPLFPNLREDVLINLVPEAKDEKDEFIERLLSASQKHASSTVSSPTSSTPTQSFRSSAPSLRLSPPPFTLKPFNVYLLADKSPLEIQNEIRALLAKYIPPSNTAVDTPASHEFPEASKWLLDSEADLFAPMFSHGFEGLPESLCPSLDMIIAVGADGREQKESTLIDETERQACSLATRMSEHIEGLGNKGFTGARGCRVTIKHTIRTILCYLRSYPGITIDDIAAGHYLLPCLEQVIKQNPRIRVIVLEFDLKTGSQAILSLRSLLPHDLFKLIVVGESSASGNTHGTGNRIYVRTSIGKTTMSFSALPSPLLKEKPKIRRLESAKVSVMARADCVASPWSSEETHDYKACVAVAHDGISARRVYCGVINSESHSRNNVSNSIPVAPIIAVPVPKSRDPSPGSLASHQTDPPRPSTSSTPSRLRGRSPHYAELPGDTPHRPRRGSEPQVAHSRTHHHQSPPPFPPPANARVQGIARRDSDTNSHGGGVSISSPTSSTAPCPLPLPLPFPSSTASIASSSSSKSQSSKSRSKAAATQAASIPSRLPDRNAKANKILGKVNTITITPPGTVASPPMQQQPPHTSSRNQDWSKGSYLIPDGAESDDESEGIDGDDGLDVIDHLRPEDVVDDEIRMEMMQKSLKAMEVKRNVYGNSKGGGYLGEELGGMSDEDWEGDPQLAAARRKGSKAFRWLGIDT